MAAEAPMDVLGLDHVDLTVNDLARSIPFYEEVLSALGFRRVPHATYVAWANAHLAIVLRPAERNAVFDRYRVGLHHLALRVRSREEVDRFHDLLVREGITVLDPPAVPRVRPAVLRGLLRRSGRDEARGRPLPVGVLAQGPERGAR